MDTYTQLKVFSNTSEEEVNAFLKENNHLAPVVITAVVVALPGRNNMLVPNLTVVVQLHLPGETIEATQVVETPIATAPAADADKTGTPATATQQ